MSTATINQPFAVGIGVDVSKAKLDLAIRLSDKSYLESNFGNNAKDIAALCGFLKHQEATCAAPLIIESTGDYHLRSAITIKQRGYNVKLINPIATKRYQKSSVRNAKTDKIDARRLADMAFLERDLSDFAANIDLIKARKLTSLLAHLTKVKQQLKTSLKRFNETAQVLGLKHPIQHLEAAIAEIEAEIKLTRQALVELMPTKLVNMADKIKGLSAEQLSVIYAMIGDKKFSNVDQLTAFFGLDVAAKQSGKWVGKSKLSKRGNAFARKVLYQIAWGLKTHNEIFKACYKNYREKKKKHYTATLMILARKFLRLYFSMNCKGADI
jgi:transposase